MKLRSQAFFCSLCLLRHPQHVADEYPVTSSRIVDKDMSDCSDDFPVLKDRTSAHSLNDTPAFFNEILVCDPDYHIFYRIRIVFVDFFDFYLKFFHVIFF